MCFSTLCFIALLFARVLSDKTPWHLLEAWISEALPTQNRYKFFLFKK
jgi:hypothetical protein